MEKDQRTQRDQGRRQAIIKSNLTPDRVEELPVFKEAEKEDKPSIEFGIGDVVSDVVSDDFDKSYADMKVDDIYGEDVVEESKETPVVKKNKWKKRKKLDAQNVESEKKSSTDLV